MARKSDRNLDAAERWLRDNDPNYVCASRAWHTPQTDALERSLTSVDDPDLDFEKAMISSRRLRIPGRPGSHGVPGTPAVIGPGHHRTKPAKDSDA